MLLGAQTSAVFTEADLPSKEIKPRYDSSPHPRHGCRVVHDSGKHLNPLVVNAYGKAGKRLRRLCGKPLREVVERFSKKTPVDIDLGWRNAQHQLCCRLVGELQSEGP